MIADGEAELRNMIEAKYRSYNRWARWWSAVYHSSLYLTTALSAAVALVLKLGFADGFRYQNDLSAGLAGLAAMLAAVTAAGGFDRKWRVSRASRNKLELLRIDLLTPSMDIGEARKALKETVQKHEDGVSGAEE